MTRTLFATTATLVAAWICTTPATAQEVTRDTVPGILHGARLA
jgi:hypothetical protein